MNLLLNLLVAVQIISALVMIGLVLIQHGKGADMGASFGSGASGSLFGATGSANFLSRSTAVCAAVFFLCTLALAYTSNDRTSGSTGSVLDRPASSAPAASVPATGAAQIPSAASAPATVAPGAAVPATPAAAPAPTAPTAPSPSASGAGAIPAK
ncbi:MAG: preprotein translocase subunit SecG [Methylibium sp. NZG]|nr:MAG: preprotein translocase subunit SecG [Methylibium sp. NZG]